MTVCYEMIWRLCFCFDQAVNKNKKMLLASSVQDVHLCKIILETCISVCSFEK